MRQDRWVERFVEEVLPKLDRVFKPSLVVIFGSRVRGDADEESDLDVIVVSKAFADIPFLKRMPLLLRLADFAKHIDFLCYTPEEFAKLKGSSSVISRALSEGIVIKREDGLYMASSEV